MGREGGRKEGRKGRDNKEGGERTSERDSEKQHDTSKKSERGAKAVAGEWRSNWLQRDESRESVPSLSVVRAPQTQWRQ